MKFAKYHALGNDYLVIDPLDLPWELTPERVRVICHRNFGVGSDGILLGPAQSSNARFTLRIFNPDGSEAEKSGNGLRIFSRYLWDQKLVGSEELLPRHSAAWSNPTVQDNGPCARRDGPRKFLERPDSRRRTRREVINEQIQAGDRTFTYCAATVGNLHCVIPLPEVSADLASATGRCWRRTRIFPANERAISR